MASNTTLFRAIEKYCHHCHEEEKHDYRNPYERDRDRILYNRAFRRLTGKTQIFLSSTHDHIRNRLTHSLEVSQIAKTIAKQLGLDQTLTEAIALSHDIGHTPFGHVGEWTLNAVMNGCIEVSKNSLFVPEDIRGFKHNLQGLRFVCDRLKWTSLFDGINLTKYTLWGIVHHTKLKYRNDVDDTSREPNKLCEYVTKDNICFGSRAGDCPFMGKSSVKFYNKYIDVCTVEINDIPKPSWTFEALIVAIADEIAQRHHDIEDGLLAKILDSSELIEVIREIAYANNILTESKHLQALESMEHNSKSHFFGYYASRFIVDLYVSKTITAIRRYLGHIANGYSIKTHRDFVRIYPSIDPYTIMKEFPFGKCMPEMQKFDEALHDYLRNRILGSYAVQRMDGVGDYIIRHLFNAFINNTRQLPDATIINIIRPYKKGMGIDTPEFYSPALIGNFRDELVEWQKDERMRLELLRGICDYISAMTDDYAIREYQSLYGNQVINSLML